MSKKFCHCGAEIPEGRLKALPNTTTCMAHSETGRKGAVTVQIGEGDHTYNDIVILEPEQIEQYNQLMGAFGINDPFEEEPEESIETPEVVESSEDEEDIYEREEDLVDDLDDQDWELSDDEENA
jgi:hypothetical protein